MKAGDFFSEWKDDPRYTKIFALIAMVLMLVLFWIITNIPSEQGRANVFMFMAVIGFVVMAIDFPESKKELFSFVSLGQTLPQIGLALGVGGTAAFLLQTQGMALINAPLNTSFSIVPLAFIYTVIAAPIFEEMLFRMALYPTFSNFLTSFSGNKIIAGIFSVVLVSGAFAWMHWLAYGANTGSMYAAFIFSVMAILGNRVFASAGFGLGFHAVNNWLVWNLLNGGA